MKVNAVDRRQRIRAHPLAVTIESKKLTCETHRQYDCGSKKVGSAKPRYSRLYYYHQWQYYHLLPELFLSSWATICCRKEASGRRCWHLTRTRETSETSWMFDGQASVTQAQQAWVHSESRTAIHVQHVCWACSACPARSACRGRVLAGRYSHSILALRIVICSQTTQQSALLLLSQRQSHEGTCASLHDETVPRAACAYSGQYTALYRTWYPDAPAKPSARTAHPIDN